jgi:hypothetical protein
VEERTATVIHHHMDLEAAPMAEAALHTISGGPYRYGGSSS